MGQLLDHSNGITGDILIDAHYTDEPSVARFVDRASQTALCHAPGSGFSYSNAAFSIAGRLIEVVTGESWFDAIDNRIFKPLGLTHAISHPSQVLRFRAAMGHLRDPIDPKQWQIAPRCYLPMGCAPRWGNHYHCRQLI